jgi:hypothetical protein
MLVRLLDFRSFDQTLDLPDDITAAQLREILLSEFQYDISYAALYHEGREILPGAKLFSSQFTSNNVIVLFNSRIFPGKSYPKVDQAFRFFPSRYQEFFYEGVQLDDSEPPPRTNPSEGAAARHRQFVNDRWERADIDPENFFARIGRLPGAMGLREPRGVAGLPRDFDLLREDAEMFLGRQPPAGLNAPLGAFDLGIRAGRGLALPVLRDRQQQAGLEELRILFGVPDDVEFSAEEFQALIRLEASGMDRRTILGTYLACDRNEAVTQDCLMSMG